MGISEKADDAVNDCGDEEARQDHSAPAPGDLLLLRVAHSDKVGRLEKEKVEGA
jgi:hypothetical protein